MRLQSRVGHIWFPHKKEELHSIDILLIFVELVKSMVWGKLNASTHIWDLSSPTPFNWGSLLR